MSAVFFLDASYLLTHSFSSIVTEIVPTHVSSHRMRPNGKEMDDALVNRLKLIITIFADNICEFLERIID
jgi:hypothetical protein